MSAKAMKARAAQNRVKAPITSINCNSHVLEMQLQQYNRTSHTCWMNQSIKDNIAMFTVMNKARHRHFDSKSEQKKETLHSKINIYFFRNCNKNYNTYWLTRNPKVSKISSVFFLPIFDMSTCNFLTRPLFHRRSSDCSIKTCKSTNKQKIHSF